MKKLQWAAGAVFSLAVILIVLISAFEIGMYADFDFYQEEYEKYDVLDDLDMTMEDTMYVTREMMAYLRGNRDTLSVTTTVEGTEQDFFNEQDRFHMAEVRTLFIGGLNLRWICVGIAALCLLFLILKKANICRILSRTYQIVLCVTALLTAALGLGVAQNFDAVFVKFHEIFFDNDQWLFDPAEDFMIRMLPEGLFYDFVIRIGTIFVTGLAILLLASLAAGLFGRRKTDKQSAA